MNLESKLKKINQVTKSKNCIDFRIQNFDSCNLSMIGSFDYCYYHDLEITFQKISYISLPVDFIYPVFRTATDREINFISQVIALENKDRVFCIEAETSSSIEKLLFFVVAENILLSEDRVYYFWKEDLQENERIADWVKRQ